MPLKKKYRHPKKKYIVYTRKNPVMRLRSFIELFGLDIEIQLPVTTAASSHEECQEKISKAEADLLSELFRKSVAWHSLAILGYSRKDVAKLYRKVLASLILEDL